MQGGLTHLLKDGYKHFSGLEEATLKNIDATKQLARITSTSLGPNGMNKLVINHLERVFVTSDTGTIVKELEVMHPAAKMVVMAATMQEAEYGDATNFVVTIAGELLLAAEELIRRGLHVADIIAGYEKATEHALAQMEAVAETRVTDLGDEKQLREVLRPVVMAKQMGYDDLLATALAKACSIVVRQRGGRTTLNVDNIRVAKLVGGSVYDSTVVRGVVVQRPPMTVATRAEACKVAVFGCGIEAAATEAKGTVVIKNAEELVSYSKSEEVAMEEAIQGIAESGCKVVVSGGSVSEMAMHFLDKYNLVCVKISSKWELRRLCRAIGATACVRLGAPTPEEMGAADVVETIEIGGSRVTVFRQDTSEVGTVATLLLRGATMNLLDDIERAVDDAVNAIKTLCKDGRVVPGAGATEIELAHRVGVFADSSSDLDQYAIKKFAEALEVVPRTLSDNSGHKSNEVVSTLYAAHVAGRTAVGVNISADAEDGTVDAAEAAIFDLFATKYNALKLASDAAITVLRVDQIIMAKAAGGPKPPKQGPMDA